MEGFDIVHNNSLLISSTGVDPMLSAAFTSQCPLSPLVSAGNMVNPQHFPPPKLYDNDDFYHNQCTNRRNSFGDSSQINGCFNEGTGKNSFNNIASRYITLTPFNTIPNSADQRNYGMENNTSAFNADCLSPTTSSTLGSNYSQMYGSESHFIFGDEIINSENNHERIAPHPLGNRIDHFNTTSSDIYSYNQITHQDDSLMSTPLEENAFTSGSATVDAGTNLFVYKTGSSFDESCCSLTMDSSATSSEPPLSATTTVSSNCSSGDGKLDNSSSNCFRFTNNAVGDKEERKLNHKLTTEDDNIFNDESKYHTVNTDNKKAVDIMSTSSMSCINTIKYECDYGEFPNTANKLDVSVSTSATPQREHMTSTIRVMGNGNETSHINSYLPLYPRSPKIEKYYITNSRSTTTNTAKFSIGNDFNLQNSNECQTRMENGRNKAANNFSKNTVEMKCSSPSSISSTINSVVVKNMNYSSGGGYNNGASSYPTCPNFPISSRPVNIIVNDMSSSSTSKHIPLPNFDIKVEQKFDYCVADEGFSPQHSLSLTSTSMNCEGSDTCDVEELNTHDLAQRISQELKRYSIPQAIFAQRVLCRSQGTLSDLLRNPKPWSKLKSGRETFRRMAKWLQEPEFQRMSALRLAACKRKEEQNINSLCVLNNTSILHHQQQPHQQNHRQQHDQEQQPQQQQQQEKEEETERQQNQHRQSSSTVKKPRLVFTDIQRRTLYAIFKETKRPSREMQLTISQQLNLDTTTVANFFMNARRRGHDRHMNNINDYDCVHATNSDNGSDRYSSENYGGEKYGGSKSVTPTFSSSSSMSSESSLSPTFSIPTPSWSCFTSATGNSTPTVNAAESSQLTPPLSILFPKKQVLLENSNTDGSPARNCGNAVDPLTSSTSFKVLPPHQNSDICHFSTFNEPSSSFLRSNHVKLSL